MIARAIGMCQVYIKKSEQQVKLLIAKSKDDLLVAGEKTDMRFLGSNIDEQFNIRNMIVDS